MGGYVFKIIARDLWAEAETCGSLRGAPVDIADGYIHFSTQDQVVETAARHFAARRDLVIIAVDPEKVSHALKWEPSRGGALFPHLYAALATQDVAWVKPLPLGRDGIHDFSGLLA